MKRHFGIPRPTKDESPIGNAAIGMLIVGILVGIILIELQALGIYVP